VKENRHRVAVRNNALAMAHPVVAARHCPQRTCLRRMLERGAVGKRDPPKASGIVFQCGREKFPNTARGEGAIPTASVREFNAFAMGNQ
jgi:hypothetical protein